MSRFPFISIVFPVYNERENLAPLVDRLKPVLEGVTSEFEVVFVDDGSRDGSAEMLDALNASDAR
ncbi:MAG TPA: glycosyltransferase, partial [Thermoanaerobaculia bacterium]